jgi:protoporphyrinogen oxidase
MTPVAIVGAGITGLTAAFYMQRQNIPVTLYESSSRAGGMIQSVRRGGFVIERGPNTILESAEEVSALITDLALKSRCLYPAPEMSARYMVRDGRMLRLPQSALAALRTPLLSFRAKIRVLGEPFVRRGILEDEPLSAFVTRRLGSEPLEYLIDPFVGGVYAGDPDCLSVTHAFPKLHALEQTYGSLIKGALLGARARRRRGAVSKAAAPMLTFDAGLTVLVEALQARLDGAVHLDSAVAGVRRDESGWTIETSAGASRKHSAVLLCAPAYRVAGLNINIRGWQDLASLREIYYPSIARVAVGFRRDQIAHALDGFGVLIPRKERMNTLGILFSSSLFPNRAPDGYSMLTAYLGGSRGRDVVNTTDAGLIELALTDMRKLVGASGCPVFEDVVRIPRSIPQYNVGYGAVKDTIGRLEAQAPGVFLAGSYRAGISVADCIVGGKAAAEKVLQYIAHA